MDEAYRLTFEIEGDAFTLKSVRRLAMRVPPGQDAAAMRAELGGRFVELRGAGGVPLYRHHVGDLASTMTEYPTGDPARPFGWTKLPRRLFSVLVPVIDGGRSVAIVEVGGRPAGKRAAKGAASSSRALATVELPRGKRAL